MCSACFVLAKQPAGASTPAGCRSGWRSTTPTRARCCRPAPRAPTTISTAPRRTISSRSSRSQLRKRVNQTCYSRNPERFYFIVLVDSQEILYIDTEEILPIHREKHVFSSKILRGKMSNFQGKKFLRYYLKLRNGEETCFQDFVDTLDLPKKGSIYIF